MNIPNVSSSSALSTLKAHRNVLEGLLPSQGATQLQRNLGPRLRDLARVMTSPYASLDPAHPRERDFQRLLWLQANTSGLIVLLLNATVRTVALDDEVSRYSHIRPGKKGSEPPLFLSFHSGVNSCHPREVRQLDIGIWYSKPAFSSSARHGGCGNN